MAKAKRATIGLLIAIICILAIWSYIFVSGLKYREPSRAKLVHTPELYICI